MTSPTGPLTARLEGIEERLAAACERYRVPGAALAVRSGDELIECAAGVLNRDTGATATPDALFQIGSITKVFTTTLVMQLVGEGRVELDEPVRRYLPEFAPASRETGNRVTVRQLLNHTSGIEGDFFIDTGRGDDCVERFVLALQGLPIAYEPGTLWSYSNAGFVVAGRLVEKLTGLSWDAALKSRIAKPLALETLGTLPEEAILGRPAIGHGYRDGDWRPATLWALPRSNGPAGATPFAAARDLLTFAWMHLDGGVAASGERLLPGALVTEMQRRQVQVPGPAEADEWGLGWALFNWGGERVIGHDGGTIGQSSFLRVAPGRRFGAALLTNGGNTAALGRRILGDVFERGAGITPRALPEPVAGAWIDPERVIGRYEKLSGIYDVQFEEEKLVAVFTARGPIEDATVTYDLTPLDDRSFIAIARPTTVRGTLVFLDPGADGRFTYVRDTRVFRRVQG